VVRNPRYSTAIGLLLTGLAQRERQQLVKMRTGSLRQLIDKMKSWFQGNF
jgi:cell division protein FtsA